ncbi:hypothetical protein Pmani_030694 [Petrolisthes manimaculis]|uniref:Uncharacterized protein n=1 Tax=Petrolisthes manimaculis TaxID=1843537 RepID=A0AAE1NVH0_9EUCA|nr:hypothetical protein Pmani_030694 [Petrolisthes manimaculis]
MLGHYHIRSLTTKPFQHHHHIRSPPHIITSGHHHTSHQVTTTHHIRSPPPINTSGHHYHTPPHITSGHHHVSLIVHSFSLSMCSSYLGRVHPLPSPSSLQQPAREGGRERGLPSCLLVFYSASLTTYSGWSLGGFG